MINRSQNSTPYLLNIAGSSTFGRYPKISLEKTQNMFLSDDWLVPYAGYQVAIPASNFNNGRQGRGLYVSTKLNKLVIVIDNIAYLGTITFDQYQKRVITSQIIPIGQLLTSSGIVYITGNNKPQIAFSDGVAIYVYDENPPMGVNVFSIATQDGTTPIDFVPGYIDFHDTYILCAAQSDGFYSPSATNSWRLSDSNNALLFPDDAAHIGLLQTKGDNTQAVIRFPSRGNVICVFGKTVAELWTDVGYQLFPYQRNTSSNFDYGCLNPATIAYLDELVVWLGVNEKAGPVIMFSDGGAPEQITTDGIDYLMSNMQHPENSQAFLYRQDGHLFYHINFYSANISLFYDFNTKKFFHATDEHGNYFIASYLAFFNNQYYFLSRNNGNLYALDTVFTTYDGAEIPRIRVCKHIRNIKQEPFITTDLGFTIETGETASIARNVGPIYLTTEDGKLFITEDGNNLISEQAEIVHLNPHVDLSISIDGGQHFSSYESIELPPLGQRKNKLTWWQLGWANDLVPQFRFYGLGRFVATDGEVNTRQ